MNNKETGKIGENVACVFLKKRNFYIFQRNYLKKWGEIDIIAQKEGIFHFFEVKSLGVKDKGRLEWACQSFRPEENVHVQKRRRLKRTIQTFFAEQKNSMDTTFKFHVIVVFLNFTTRRARVSILEDVIL